MGYGVLCPLTTISRQSNYGLILVLFQQKSPEVVTDEQSTRGGKFAHLFPGFELITCF